MILKKVATVEELDNIDIDELLRFIEVQDTKRKLRKARPWVFDLIRVLWGHRSSQGMRTEVLVRELWHLREPSGLNMPKRFPETIQSCLNQHTSQSNVWAKNGAKPDDDLFWSPQGKGSGTWAIHRERAVAWLKSRGLPEL
jgi:hypothetical protein